MNVELINPFIESTVKVLTTMAKIDPKPGKPVVKQGHKAWGVVTGMIGMAGKDVSGNLVISFDESSILEIVSNMLMEEFTKINQDVVDAVGEITNMISGGTKSALAAKGFSFDMATPVMLVGNDIELSQHHRTPVISLQFTTQKGQFVVEANVAKREHS